jgi:FkbM family methyltransferase
MEVVLMTEKEPLGASNRFFPIYRAYYAFYQYFYWVRGFTRLRLIIEDIIMSEVLDKESEGFSITYKDTKIIMENKNHFKELIFHSNVLYGYRAGKIDSKDVILDAGAYPGDFTIYAAKNADKVIALEPDASNIDELRRNLALNDLENVEIIDWGLWSEERKLNFESKNSVLSGIKEDGGSEIQVTTLDKLSSKEHNLDFIKMDIEGAEIEALKGAEVVMEEEEPFFAIASYHKVGGVMTHKKLESIFSKHGFSYKTHYEKHLTTLAAKELKE